MWTCWKALILTLSDVMINCNCFNDRDHSLLVSNEVSDSCFTFWMNYYSNIRNYMAIYVVVLKIIMMPSCSYFILLTPLSLNMWTYLSIPAFAWGQARSKLGELICPFCNMLLCWYLLHYRLLFHIMSQYFWLFSLIL